MGPTGHFLIMSLTPNRVRRDGQERLNGFLHFNVRFSTMIMNILNATSSTHLWSVIRGGHVEESQQSFSLPVWKGNEFGCNIFPVHLMSRLKNYWD